MNRLLDLGCGAFDFEHTIKGFKEEVDEIYGIDLQDFGNPHIKVCDIVTDPFPFPDNYFTYVRAHNILEHIPKLIYYPKRRYPFVEVMNEIHRVLVPDGKCEILVPVHPNISSFTDPTHVSHITLNTITGYFCIEGRYLFEYCQAHYGYKGTFSVWEINWELQEVAHLLIKKI